MTAEPTPLSAKELAADREAMNRLPDWSRPYAISSFPSARWLATIDALTDQVAALMARPLQRDSDELKARAALLTARDPEARSNPAIEWAYNELTARKAWSKGAVAAIIAEQYDRAEAAEAERGALKVERDRLREVAKTSLCVLCAAKDGQSWSLPMVKDFDIAIGMCRAALSPPKPQPTQES
jgi:hypothetical protein